MRQLDFDHVHPWALQELPQDCGKQAAYAELDAGGAGN